MSKKDEKKELKFTKEQILKANRFLTYQDILNAFLKDSEEYSINEVQTKIDNFLTTKVR